MKREIIKIPHKDTHVLIHINGEFHKEELIPVSHLGLRKSKIQSTDKYECYNGLVGTWIRINEEQYSVIASLLCLEEV